MTWLDEIPLEQKEVVEELRRRTINDCTPRMLEDPSLFYRFLKGNNFNLKNAEAMLRKHISWKKENGVDTILTDFKHYEEMKKYFPINKIGCDKEGFPIIYGDVGRVDSIGFFKAYRKADILAYSIYLPEWQTNMLLAESQKAGRLITQCVIIYNFEELSLQNAANKRLIETLMEHISMHQNNYPERTKAVYVINVSRYFTIIFALVKLVITSGLLSKVHIYGKDGWKEALLEIIDEDVLPAFLGGKKTDPDGFKHYMACKVPEKYYLSLKTRTIQNEEGVKKILITRRSSIEIAINVVHANSVLTWEFETKNRDIKFGVSFKASGQIDEEVVELIPKKRIIASDETEVGNHVCSSAGTYILIFDNSYSWIFSKEIYYRTNVIPPSTR